MRAKLIEYSAMGYSHVAIAKLMKISKFTIAKWRSVYPDLKEAMDKAEHDSALDCIREGLFQNARGQQQIEETTSFFKKKVIDGEEQLVKTTVKTKTLPPDNNAIRLLANKYAKGEYVDNSDNEVNVNVRITQKDRALSLEERKRILLEDKDTIPLDEEDYKLIEQLEGKD